MSEEERARWDERYSTGDYQPRTAASPFLEEWIDRIPVGRALDIACGAGRNALRLARAGHRVDAVDVSAAGLEMARARADELSVDVNWIVADLDEHRLEPAAYDLIVVIRYVNPALWPRLVNALAPDGWLLIEHHMRTEIDALGPSSPEFRLGPQELLAAFGQLRIVFYAETLEPADHPADAGLGQYAIARMVACNGNPGF